MQNFFRHRTRPRALFAAILLAVIGTLPGCRKEKNAPPAVDVIAPAEGHQLYVPDTLFIHLRVHDDRAVESVWCALTDAQGVPIAPAVSRTVGGTGDVYLELPVTAPATPGGTYSLHVRVSDGDATGSAFRSIMVHPEPLRLRALFLVPPEGTAPAPIIRIDSAGHMSTFTTLGDISGGAVSSAQQYVAFAGHALAPLTAHATQGTGSWQLAASNTPGAPAFQGLRTDPSDGRFYVSTSDGFIRGFHPQGQQQFTAVVDAGAQSYRTAVAAGRLVSAQHLPGQLTDRLATYTLPAGAPQAMHPLAIEVVHMDACDADHVLVFGHRDGQGVVQRFHVALGGMWEMHVFNEGPIRAVQQLGPQLWAVALPGRIVRFHHPTNGVSIITEGITADALGYDAANGRLHAAAGSELWTIDPATGGVLGSVPVPGAVGTILPLLNR